MAYLEVWKNGRRITRRKVDEEKARKGCKVHLGQAGEARVAIGESATVGPFEVRMFAGDPPEVQPDVEESVFAQQGAVPARPSWIFPSVALPLMSVGKICGRILKGTGSSNR